MQMWYAALMAGLLSMGTLQALDPWSSQAADDWMARHPDPTQWAEGMRELQNALETRLQQKQADTFRYDTDFLRWLQFARWVNLGQQSAEILEPEARQTHFFRLASLPEITGPFLEILHPQDNRPHALGILLDLWGQQADDVREFAALAAAFSVVFDQPFPRNWPHHQVKPSAVPFGKESVAERFADLVAAQRAGDLLLDPRKLRAEELKFVVDTRVSLTELTWARQNYKTTLNKLQRSYQDVRYDHPRARKEIFDWPYPTYTLADILQRGGICVDQAYFAATVGKARGVPTLYFSGQGSGGGHAWFGHMERPGKWIMDIGRYESQNYPVGEALDPQLWNTIPDDALALLIADLLRQPAFAAARAALGWAELASDPSTARERLRMARNIMPELPDTWFAEEKVLQQLKDEESLVHLYESWTLQFNRQPDFKIHAQNALLAIQRSRGNSEAVAALGKEIQRENRRKRFDLGIGAGADALLEHIEARQWPEARQEFRRIVRRFDEQGGGNLFYQIIEPYVLACASEQQWDLAEEAIKYAEKRMPVESGSILDMEFDRLRLIVKRRLRPDSDSY